MSAESQPLAALAEQLMGRVSAGCASVAALRLPDGGHRAATLWQPDVLIASEQSLPEHEAFEVIGADGQMAAAKLVGRDAGTNIAVLRLEKSSAAAAPAAMPARLGMLVIALGCDMRGACSVRVGVVNAVGPEWRSLRGGRLDARVQLDLRLAPSEEGGPVFDTSGAWLGFSTFGPRGQILLIPAATVERVAPVLIERGHVPRGWLGVSLRPVQVPDELRQAAGGAVGLMVMSLSEGGPAAEAGVVAGDIIVSIDGRSPAGIRGLAAQLGGESIGRRSVLQVIRGGSVMTLQVSISERPAG